MKLSKKKNRKKSLKGGGMISSIVGLALKPVKYTLTPIFNRLGSKKKNKNDIIKNNNLIIYNLKTLVALGNIKGQGKIYIKDLEYI